MKFLDKFFAGVFFIPRVVLSVVLSVLLYPVLFVSYFLWVRRLRKTVRRVAQEWGVAMAAILRAEYPDSFSEYRDHMFTRSRVGASGIKTIPVLDFAAPQKEFFEKWESLNRVVERD